MFGEDLNRIYCGPAPLPAEAWTRLNLDPLLLLGLALMALAVGRDRRGLAALAVLLLAFVSPLCALSSALFSARVVHHLLLVVVVAVEVDTTAPGGGGGGGGGTRNHESGTDGSGVNGSYSGGGGGASPLHVAGKGRFGGDGGDAAGGGTEQSASGAVIELQKSSCRP